MVSRRSYIATAIGSASLLWYGLTQNPLQNTTPSSSENKNKYIGSETKRSGTTTGVKDIIKIPKDTITSKVTVSAKTNSQCEIYLIEQGGLSYERIFASTDENLNSREDINMLQSGEYTLSVKGEVDKWSVKIENYTSIPDRGVVRNVPMEKSTSGVKVYGPIAITPFPKTEIKFNTLSPADRENTVSLIQIAEKYRVVDILSIASESTKQKQFTGRLDGVGFIKVQSDTNWKLEINQTNG